MAVQAHQADRAVSARRPYVRLHERFQPVDCAEPRRSPTAHVYGEMLKAAAGIDMTHVPYKGAGPAVQDIMAGHATSGIHDLGSVGAHVASGKLVALAVTGPRRWPALPDLPTFAEQGYALDIAGWNAIHAPAGTPRAIVERMSAEINRVIQSPEGRERC
ncbi:MAG: tripartite tricarboxylate transporter substrate-binding protein [Betaproteobacteria bacterium]